MVKMNFTNKQTAFEYALYMIAASYFAKTTCKSGFMEQNMLIQYKEQKSDNQYQMEEICAKYMESILHKSPPIVLKQNMTAFLKRRDNSPMEIFFMNDNFIVRFKGVYTGKKSKIEHKIWVKKQLMQGASPA